MEKNLFCNLCGSKKSKIFISSIKSPEFDERFTLVKCINCGLIFLNPRPTKKSINKYYSTENYFSVAADAKQAYSHLYNIVFSKVRKGLVFDIGAGSGLFLTEFRKRGWEIDGLEPSETARRIAQKKFKILLRKKDFLDINFKEEIFDLVLLNNVIEHLYAPVSTLKKASKTIKKGGHILISCPNIDSFGSLIFRKKWYAMDVPRHLYQFNPDTLGKALEISGFKIVEISHAFYKHNYMTLFESFRRTLSPRFSEMNEKEREKPRLESVTVVPKQSLVKKAGIICSKIFSSIIAFLEPIFKRGEIITVLAVKS